MYIDNHTLPREASMSFKSSWSMKPSLFWSIMLKASLNSWIWSWSNMAKTLDVALWARFLVPALRAVFRHAISGFLSQARLEGASATHAPCQPSNHRLVLRTCLFKVPPNRHHKYSQGWLLGLFPTSRIAGLNKFLKMGNILLSGS